MGRNHTIHLETIGLRNDLKKMNMVLQDSVGIEKKDHLGIVIEGEIAIVNKIVQRVGKKIGSVQ